MAFHITHYLQGKRLVISDIPLPPKGKGRIDSNRSSPQVQNKKGRNGLSGITADVHEQEAPKASCCLSCSSPACLMLCFWALNAKYVKQGSYCCIPQNGDSPEAICSAILFPYTVGQRIQALVPWNKDSPLTTSTLTWKACHWKMPFHLSELGSW